jgi:hypothetical protein
MKTLITVMCLFCSQLILAQNGTIEAVEGIVVGNNSGTVDGTIRYTGSDVEARISGTWESLTGGTGTPIWNLSGLNAYYSDGNVGIGTTSPSSLLHVVNDGSLSEVVDFTTGTLTANNDLLNLTIGASSNDDAQIIEARRGSAEVFIVNADGQTSIGKGNPIEQLDVDGAIKLGTTTSTNSGTIRYTGSDFEGYTGGSWESLIGGSSLWNQNGTDIEYSAGQVGIGVANPLEALHVDGDFRFEGAQYLEWYEGLTQKAYLRYSGTDMFLYNNESSGSIEIKADDDFIVQTGTGSGATRLFVNQSGESRFGASSNNSVSINPLDDSDPSASTTTSSSIILKDNDGSETITMFGSNVGNTGGWMSLADSGGNQTVEFNSDYLGGGEIVLSEDGGTELITIQAQETSTTGAAVKMYNIAGELTIELDSDFSSNGRIITDEVEIKGGSDFAEHFDVINKDIVVLPGMVVSIDPNSTGKLKVTNEDYDNKVAGIVSGANGVKTGLMMGQTGSIADGEYAVALTGRVYVYANNNGGEILPGDLLTTSSQMGYAMKAGDLLKAQGSIIGKAMTKVDENGFVLVLVNLQ